MPLLAVLAVAVVLFVGCAVACGGTVLIGHLAGLPSANLESKILGYCETHEEIRLSNVTDFDWDVAYVEGPEAYGRGERLKREYK